MKFRFIIFTGVMLLAVVSVMVLSDIISGLKNSPEIVFYKSHPERAYAVFTVCKNHPDPIDDCYAAYSAAVSLADSEDCSVTGKETKRRFKRLVEHAKEETITEEIDSDCNSVKEPSFFEKWSWKKG